MRQRHYLKVGTIALICTSLLLLVNWLPLAGDAPKASAHAFVVGSDPVDGSTISVPPTQVRIYFDAPISPASQAIVYAFAPGASNGLLVNTNHGTINPNNSRELDIALLPPSRLPQGGYEVNWTALSLSDGHTASGLIGFNLGLSNTGSAGTPTLGPSTSNHFPQLSMQGLLSVAWDWLVTLALLFWIGILVTELLIIPPVVAPSLLAQVRKHSRSLQALCLAGLLVGEGINLILRSTMFTQTVSAGGISLANLEQLLLHTNYGYLWLARVFLLLVALFFFWWSNPARQRRAHGSGLVASRKGKRWRQMRQQARIDELATLPGTPASQISGLSTPRSQARVTGAVVTSFSQARSVTSSQGRSAAHVREVEEPVPQIPTWQKSVWLVLAALTLLTLVLSNELLQLVPLPISAGLFSWLALAAQAVWFGCVAYLGFTLFPLLPTTNPDQHAEVGIRVLKRARPFLLSSLAVLLVCELFLGEATIYTPVLFVSDAFGRALLVRDIVLLALVGVTGYILFVLLPRLQRQVVLLPVVTAEMPARRTRTAELEKTARTTRRALQILSAGAAVTLVCVALMNFYAPPVVFPAVNYAAPVTSQAPAISTPTSQEQTVNGLNITLAVSPARVGHANTVTIDLKDAQGTPINNATVKLTLDMQLMNMGITTATIQHGNPTYTATFAANQTFNMAGIWLVRVEIDRQGQQTVQSTFHVMAAD